jgi:hypothetical protein
MLQMRFEDTQKNILIGEYQTVMLSFLSIADSKRWEHFTEWAGMLAMSCMQYTDERADPRERWKTAYHQYQTACSSYTYLTCFCTRCISRTAVVFLPHSVWVRVSTTWCTYKTCIPSMDFATVSRRPYVTAKVLFTKMEIQTSTANLRSSCNLISPSATTVLHQPVGWKLGVS